MNKIDFSVIFEVKKANPNGDPDNANMPRTDSREHGIVTQVALKRKLRNVLHLMSGPIFLANKDNDAELYPEETFKQIAEDYNQISKFNKKDEIDDYEKELKAFFCNKFIDVRCFGQVITTTAKKGSIELKNSSIRGAVSLTHGVSIAPIFTEEHAITKSISTKRENASGTNDTMGGSIKFVDYGLYRFDGTINAYQAEKNKMTEEDIETLKSALVNLFLNDESAARPTGSMNVVNVFLWEHNSKLGELNSAEVFSLLKVEPNVEGIPEKLEDYTIELTESPNSKIKSVVLK